MEQEELVPAVCPDAMRHQALVGTGKKQFGQTLLPILQYFEEQYSGAPPALQAALIP